MNRTIEVIPRRFLFNPATGATASPYGSRPYGFEARTEGYTWKITDGEGRVTVGMCRVAVKTRDEAAAIAKTFAERVGYRVIDTADGGWRKIKTLSVEETANARARMGAGEGR